MPSKARGYYRSLFWAILIVAAALRLWNLDWGLPFDAHSDEMTVFWMARNIAFSGFPHYYNYPSLLVYSTVFFGSIVWFFGHLFGQLPGWHAFWFSAAADPSIAIMIIRSISALAGVATVLLVMRISKRLWGYAESLVSGFFVAVSFIMVFYSHRAMTDSLMSAAVCATVLFALRAFETGRLWDFVLAGAFAGLAASAKYNAGIVFFVVLGAVVLRAKAEGDSGLHAIWHDRRFRWAIRSTVIAFIATTPGVVFEPVRFFSGLRREMFHMSAGHFGFEHSPTGFVYHPFVNLPIGIGWPLCIAALLGLIWLLGKDRRPQTWLFLMFPVLFFLMMGGSKVLFLRYVIPLVPFAAGLAAFFVGRLCKVIPSRGWAVAAMALLSISLAIPTAASSVRWDILAGRRSTEALAREEIQMKLQRGSTIASHVGIGGLYGTREQVEAAALAVENGERYSITGMFGRGLLDFAPDESFDYRWVFLGRDKPVDVARLRNDGVGYCLLSECIYGRWKLAPDIYGAEIASIDELLSSCDTVAAWKGIGEDMEWNLTGSSLLNAPRLGADLTLLRLR